MRKITLLMMLVASIVALNSCKKGADDPFLSLSSRDGRISAVWNMDAGTVTSVSTDKQVNAYSDSDCGDDAEGTTTTTSTDSYTSSSMSTSVSATQDDKDNLLVNDDWDDEQEFTKSITLSTYSLTIREDGTFDVSIAYSGYEEDSPLSSDEDGKEQSGKTFSGTGTTTGSWNWVDKSDDKSAINFSVFPRIYLQRTDLVDDDGDFDKNILSGVSIHEMENVVFDIEMLKSKEMRLVGEYSYSDVSTNANDEAEYPDVDDYLADYVDCVKTFTSTDTYTQTMTITLTSDGKSVKE